MSDFEKFFEIKFPNIQATIDQTHCEESILLKKACRMTWNARQSEIDQLNLSLAEMKSRLNDSYTDGQASMYRVKQKEIDQLKAEKMGLEKRLKQAESKTLMAMIHGTCECGTAWSPIVSDKEGFSLLHCFDCGNNRYENIEVFGDYSPKALRGGHE